MKWKPPHRSSGDVHDRPSRTHRAPGESAGRSHRWKIRHSPHPDLRRREAVILSCGATGNRADTSGASGGSVLRRNGRTAGDTTSPGGNGKIFAVEKIIGGGNEEMRSLLRMESPPRSLRGPSRMCTRESTQGKGSRRARLPRTAASSSRHERFSGIANRSHVIRGKRLDIKKVHVNRHFPVDTVNAIF